MAAQLLVEQGQSVVLHARNLQRAEAKIGFGIPKMAALDYVELSWILARSRDSTRYRADVERLMV